MDYLDLGDGADGVSCFETRTIGMAENDFARPAPPMLRSERRRAAALVYLELAPGWRDGKHPSPRHQIACCLSGRMRVTAGSGEVRMVEPGGIREMADTRGTGHGSEVPGVHRCRWPSYSWSERGLDRWASSGRGGGAGPVAQLVRAGRS